MVQDPAPILVVDDERAFGDMLAAILRKEGYRVDLARSGADGLERLRERGYRFVLCDLVMPGLTGIEFLDAARSEGLEPTVVIMSAYGSMDQALTAMGHGAYDYISKPFKRDEIVLVLKKAEERERLRRENRELRAALDEASRYHGMVASSDRMNQLFRVIERVAGFKTTVLLVGESGTGKELAARAIHQQSRRAEGPFVPVNCGAIPDALMESELFGHLRGAFTDAKDDKSGLFQAASGGTLLLDEIGELSFSMQVKLLRALQESEVRPVGSNEAFPVDVRVIAATHRDLGEAVKAGTFREDLFYRLNVLPIALPPLRDRKDDIPQLVDHFIERTNARLGTRVQGINAQAVAALGRYDWPGNVRELENVVERAIVMGEGEIIGVEALPPFFQQAADPVKTIADSGELSVKKAQQRIEIELIRRALKRTGGNRTAAAKLLELSHRALLYKIRDYGLDK